MEIRLSLALLLLLSISALLGQTMEERKQYADSLMGQEDYYRAISEYKMVDFFTSDKALKLYCQKNIAAAYYNSGKYRESIRTVSDINEKMPDTNDLQYWCNLRIGVSYYRLKAYLAAHSYLAQASQIDSTGLPGIYMALIDTEAGNWEGASNKLDLVIASHANDTLGVTTQEISNIIESSRYLPQKSPVLATMMSAVIPGAGQIYTKHTYDGMLAFFYVGAFTYAGLLAYNYDKDKGHGYWNTSLIFSIDALFYAGNLIGAYKTAGYRNLRQREILLDNIKAKAYSLPLP